TEPDVRDPVAPVRLEPVRGRVTFDNVTFAYDGVRPVLRGVSFDIEPGELTGLVGPSGGGKTTVVNSVRWTRRRSARSRRRSTDSSRDARCSPSRTDCPRGDERRPCSPWSTGDSPRPAHTTRRCTPPTGPTAGCTSPSFSCSRLGAAANDQPERDMQRLPFRNEPPPIGHTQLALEYRNDG